MKYLPPSHSLRPRDPALAGLDAATPGGVYLCQVNDRISCGACCGLYNVADASAPGLTKILTRRTTVFATVPRTVSAILDFAARVGTRENPHRPYPEFHHCPFIGLVGDGPSRVGCLLHPLADGNAGVDFRGLSHYGGMACRIYFCPTCKTLPARYKILLRETARDWHDYGLLITEHRFTAAFFAEVERRVGRELDPDVVLADAALREAVAGLFPLKSDWPWRDVPSKPAAYFFEDDLYPPGPVIYPPGDESPSRFDAMFRELESRFGTVADLRAAEARVENLVRRLAGEEESP